MLIRETTSFIDSFGPRSTSFPRLSKYCCIILFARVRRKHLEFPIEIQKYETKNWFFAFSLRFYIGFKNPSKTQMKVFEMLRKPLFSHMVSAGNRFFEEEFDKNKFQPRPFEKVEAVL